MSKVAVLFKDGFEEIEALTVVDVLRRANIDCLMVGMDALEATGNHRITVKMDCLFEDSLTVDMVVLPGGMPGAKYLKEDRRVLSLLQTMQQKGNYIAAICTAPIVLQEAGVCKGKRVTCFPGFEEELVDATCTGSLVEIDGKLITSRGPATALLFAYTLVEQLGKSSTALQEGMQYLALTKECNG